MRSAIWPIDFYSSSLHTPAMSSDEVWPLGTTHAAFLAPLCYIRQLPTLYQTCPRPQYNQHFLCSPGQTFFVTFNCPTSARLSTNVLFTLLPPWLHVARQAASLSPAFYPHEGISFLVLAQSLKSAYAVPFYLGKTFTLDQEILLVH